MIHNKLQLNDDKTELMLATPKKLQNNSSLPQYANINNSNIPFSPSVRNLGVIFDRTLSFKKHISSVCKLAYLELRRISTIRHYLSTDATKTLICAFVLSRLDYCNSLMAGIPNHLLNQLQKIQNNAARLIFKSSKHEHVSPLLHSLHWLSINQRINYKLSSLSFSVVTGTAPQYLSELLHIYTSSRQLRSSTDTRQFRVPFFRTKSNGQRSFSYQAPTVWNDLPAAVRHSASSTTFKSALKTYLFKQ